MLTQYVHLTANANALKVSCELLRIFVTGLHLTHPKKILLLHCKLIMSGSDRIT